MTPKEKATQLIYAFEVFTDRDNEYEFAKQCALIAVNNIIDSLQIKNYSQADKYEYWNYVKHEINLR